MSEKASGGLCPATRLHNEVILPAEGRELPIYFWWTSNAKNLIMEGKFGCDLPGGLARFED